MMSKAKWFVVRKPSKGEIIATSANQIVPTEILPDLQKCYTIFTRPPFPLAVLKGGLGRDYLLPRHLYQNETIVCSLLLVSFIPDWSISRYYLGQRSNILLVDPEIMKQITVKEFNSFVDREVISHTLYL